MSRFYGTIQGSRGQATRCGHRDLNATAASWNGAACTYVFADGDRDFAELRLTSWYGKGRYLWLYEGPVNPTDAEFFAGLLPGAPADWLRRAADALSERADALDPLTAEEGDDEDWRHAVANGDTMLGFWAWLRVQREQRAAENDGED